MNRSAKKLIYGLFYLVVFILIVFGFYNSFLKSAPGCFDKIQNQGETGIDCGGPCKPCAVAGLEPLELSAPVQFFGFASGTVLLADIVNPNPDSGALLDYQFRLYDKSDYLLKTLSGKESFNPGERKYIFYHADASVSFGDIRRVEISFSDTTWQAANQFSKLNVVLESGPTTAAAADGIKVTGTLRNQDFLSVPGVKVVAILRDKFDSPIFASQTLVTNIGGGEEKDFEVIFPQDAALSARVDLTATAVSLSSQ